MADYEFPDELNYTEEDEWVREEHDQIVIGITDFAQNQLGDIVFIELPEVGSFIDAGAPFGTIESVKAVSDLFAPLSGKVTAVNEMLEDQPELVNADCYGDGWLIALRLTDADEWDNLLSVNAYRESVADRDG